ncbi:MAG TPA: hypothetical protein VE263_12860 [Candidatus Angelobacter sp.]|nr:hypothetical protein [Candidatus Angelobacter sp.]
MHCKTVRNLLGLIALITVVWAQPLRAQAPLEPSQLPPRTLFYVIWRGVPQASVRTANSLMALWDDPDFVTVRSELAANMLSSSEKQSAQPKLTPQELGEFASLLENSFTVGYISESARHRAANAAAPAGTKPPAWNGMFFVYNRAGKEELLTKAILRMRSAEKEIPRLSQVTIAGVQVLKIEHKSDASYWAEHGKYAVATSEAGVMEELLARLENKSPQAASLAQSAAYQEAQPLVGSGLLEFFLRVPDLKDFAADSKPGPFQARQVLDAARLEAVHSLCGHVTFDGAKTHVQAAILGDTAAGTPFDIWANGSAAPASLAFAPADTISYTTGQLNLLGIYDTIKRVARAAFPVGQQGNADLLDMMAEKRLGMPLTDALGLFTGEFASVQTSPSLDSTKQVFYFAIRKKPETLKLMRAMFGDQLTSERNEGDATLLKISLGGNQGSAGVAQWNFFNLAVTPDMVIGASRIDTVREALANRAKVSATAGLASVPQFQANRANAPENLTGLSYFDFQKVDWQAVKDHWIQEAKKTSVAKSATGTNPPAAANSTEWLSQINAQIVSRHLHTSWSVSWKDAKGVHWDQWVE